MRISCVNETILHLSQEKRRQESGAQMGAFIFVTKNMAVDDKRVKDRRDK